MSCNYCLIYFKAKIIIVCGLLPEINNGNTYIGEEQCRVLLYQFLHYNSYSLQLSEYIHLLSSEFHSILTPGQWKCKTAGISSGSLDIYANRSDHWHHNQGSEIIVIIHSYFLESISTTCWPLHINKARNISPSTEELYYKNDQQIITTSNYNFFNDAVLYIITSLFVANITIMILYNFQHSDPEIRSQY